MQRKFLTNLGLLLFLNFLIKPFWILGIDRTVQNMVGAVEFGAYFAVLNFTFLFNILLDFGITNFNNKNIAQNNHLLNKHFSGIIVLKLLLAMLFMLVIFVVALILGYRSDQLWFLGLLGLNQVFISMILYLRSNISGLLLFKTDSILSVLDRLLMILICSVLLWGHLLQAPFRMEWFIYSQTLAYFLTALVAFLVVIRKAAFRKFTWNWPFFLLIIKRSFPFAILVLMMTFYNRVDSVMLERMIHGSEGKRQAGIYASAYRLLDASNMIAYLFSVLLLPIFSKMLKDKNSISHILKLSSTLLLTFSIIVACSSFFYSQELMGLLYTDHVSESARVFMLLMIGFIPISATYIYGTLLTANGNLKELNLMAACGMGISFLLNFVMIPRFFAVGSAIASLVTQTLMAGFQVYMVQRLFKFNVGYHTVRKGFLFLCGVVLFAYLSHFLPLPWFINYLLTVAVSFILASAFRLVSLQSLLSIIRNE